jgi:hypothetical protein
MMQIHRGALRRITACAVVVWVGVFLAALPAQACGLDWTLPQAHFEGVDGNGNVAYWEKIGEIDLGPNGFLPVHIGFNSHREASSSVLGKGWIVALLESHVEPIDENTMHVIMPDGWTFLFRRNGNTQTWRGNAGWAGETNDTIFTIAAPCGWKIKYDGGKIQELDGAKIGTLTYSYNGGVPTEIDHEGSAVLRVEQDSTSGKPSAIIIGGQRIALSLAQRPRVASILGRNLINGLDPSLSSLQWPDGKQQTFAFGTDKSLNPSLTITSAAQPPKTLVWDATLRQIIRDGYWTYALQTVGNHMRISRTSSGNQIESFEEDDATGMTEEKKADGPETITHRFVSGPLAGFVRRIEQVENNGATQLLYSASYYPSGAILRETFYPDEVKTYSEDRQLLKETIGGKVCYEVDLDDEGRVVRRVDATRGLEVKKTYSPNGDQVIQVFRQGVLLYTEKLDVSNKLISLNEEQK